MFATPSARDTRWADSPPPQLPRSRATLSRRGEGETRGGKVQANPDDLKAHQQLDYAYAKKRQYDKVIAMWTAYISRHPSDGTAYFERSGAYHNSKQRGLAFADVEKACALGHNTACNYAKRMPR
jgi:hypothetical protein